MKAKNTPFDMDADDVAMLAMSHLRGSGKLNDKNVDCFIEGYKTCMQALYMPKRLIPILQYHYKEFSKVEEDIDLNIGYADLRRGHTSEETSRIKQAEKLTEALKKLIEVLEEGENQ